MAHIRRGILSVLLFEILLISSTTSNAQLPYQPGPSRQVILCDTCYGLDNPDTAKNALTLAQEENIVPTNPPAPDSAEFVGGDNSYAVFNIWPNGSIDEYTSGPDQNNVYYSPCATCDF